MAKNIAIRRGRMSNVPAIAEFIRRVSGKEISEDAVQEKLFGGLWIALDDDEQIVGVAGLQVINLIACVTDFYTDPPGKKKIGSALLDELLASAKELACEVAQLYVDADAPPKVFKFLRKQDFVETVLNDIKSRYWKEIASEMLGEGQVLMQRRLKDKVTMRPL